MAEANENTNQNNIEKKQEQPLKASVRVGKNKSKRKKSTTQSKKKSPSKQNSQRKVAETPSGKNTTEMYKTDAKTRVGKEKEDKNLSTKGKDESLDKKVASKGKCEISERKLSSAKESKTSNKNQETSVHQEKNIKDQEASSKKGKTNAPKENKNLRPEENKNQKENSQVQNENQKLKQEKKLKQDKEKQELLEKKQKQKEEKKREKQEEQKRKKEEKDRKRKESQNKKQEEKELKRKEKEKQEKEHAKKLASLSKEDKIKYIQDKNQKQKKIVKVFAICLVFVIILLILSTIFAFIASTKTTIVKGVHLYGIDVSGLTEEEAKKRLQEKVDVLLDPDIEYQYGEEYNTTLDLDRISAHYDVENAVKRAYYFGRNSNIIVNNYQIIFSYLWGKDIMPDLQYNEEELMYYAKEVGSQLPGVVQNPSYEIIGEELVIDAGKDGIVIEEEQFKNITIESIKNRNESDIKEGKELEKVTIPVKEQRAEAIDLDKIKNEIYKEPKDASFVQEPFELIPEENGVDFAIPIDEAKAMLNEEKEEYRIPLNITPANKTIKDIGMEAFPYKIASYSTRYDSSNKNRSTNLQLASDKINGTVLMPGEEFSYNNVVGKRTIEEGYKEAKIYSNGSVVDGLGGGICQISSTLYNAVLLANLEITERRNHTFTTSYVAAGRDATVVYGSQDFKFKNSRTYPIKITAEVKAGVATMTINGIKEETEYEVRILPQTTSVIPYKVNQIKDSSLPAGKQVIQQAGANGCKTTTYKELVLNGTVVSRTLLSNDTYSAMTRIVRVGTGK